MGNTNSEQSDADALLAAVREQGLEGIIGKQKDSHYQPGKRSGAWIKHRVNRGQEFVVGGYFPGPHGFDSLIVGYYGRIAADWGCVALMCNPGRKIPEEVLKGWAKRVDRAPDYGNVPQTEEEGCLVSKDGLLHIPWPRLVEGDAAVQLDLLLATANDPTLTGTLPSYPSVETITDAWNRAGNDVEYFWRNADSDIRTFQDDEIRARLRPRSQTNDDPG